MHKIEGGDPEAISADLRAETIAQLRALYPELIVEKDGGAAVNVDVLKQLVGDDSVTDAEEKYGLDWHGKRRARQIAFTPSTGTLRPCPEESEQWETTQNLMIEGDNLEVLKLLQKSYSGKVKLIYIDPPYNTGRDFVYRDNFQDNIRNYMTVTGQMEGANRITSNTEASGRFHTDWLNMIYPRLKLARNLLREDGVIFVQIGEGEIANLKLICDSVFGEETCLGIACRIAKKSNNKGDHWAPNFDYLLTYAKDRSACPPFSGGANTDAYNLIEEDGPRKGERYQLVRLYMSTIANRNPEQRFWINCPDGTKVIPPGSTYPPERPNLGDGIWRWSKTKFDAERDRIVVKEVRSSNLVSDTGEPAKWNVFTKTYLSDVLEKATSKPNNLVEDHINQIGSHEMGDLGIPFDYPKPSTLIEFLIGITRTEGEDIVLDFFGGSGTTGHAVMRANAMDGGSRRFILVQLPEPIESNDANQRAAFQFCEALQKKPSIAELTKERLRRAAAKIREEHPMFSGDLGFRVFKLDATNMREWDTTPEDLEASLLEHVDHIKPDRSKSDLLFELLLKLGLDLCVSMEERTVSSEGRSHQISSVGGGVLMTCMSDRISQADVEAIGAALADWRVALSPAGDTTCVFRDSAFEDNVAKTNLSAILAQRGFTRVRSL